MIATKDGLELSNGAHVVKEIPLGEILTDRTQSRAQIDEETVSEYAELLSAGVQFPPIDVFWDGQSYWLGDGFHRHLAAQVRELTTIECKVHNGTVRDALKFSLGANIVHGLRRTNEDKRRAVEIALSDEEWRLWSDRAIARLCGVSNNFVGTVRAALPQVSSDDTSERPKTEMRLGADGKEYPATKPRSRISGGTSFDR